MSPEFPECNVRHRLARIPDRTNTDFLEAPENASAGFAALNFRLSGRVVVDVSRRLCFRINQQGFTNWYIKHDSHMRFDWRMWLVIGVSVAKSGSARIADD